MPVPESLRPIAPASTSWASNHDALCRVATDYTDKITVAQQEEAAAFDLALQTLVQHGSPHYIAYGRGNAPYRDPLNTGFRMLDTPLIVEKPDGVAAYVPAIRVGVGDISAEQERHLPLNIVRQARRGKATVALAARALGDVVGHVEVQACLLATNHEAFRHQGDVDVWGGIAKEVAAPGKLRERLAELALSNAADWTGHIRHRLQRPDLAMWYIPLPEINCPNTPSGQIVISKRYTPNLALARDPNEYAQLAELELEHIAQRTPVRVKAMELLHRAALTNRLVSSLGAATRNPQPPTI